VTRPTSEYKLRCSVSSAEPEHVQLRDNHALIAEWKERDCHNRFFGFRAQISLTPASSREFWLERLAESQRI